MRFRLTFISILTMLAVCSCAPLGGKPAFRPLSGEEAKAVRPGLMPRYFTKFFARNVQRLPPDGSTGYKNWPGTEPILQLNNQFGHGKVFGSGTNRGIGIRMRGVFSFPEPGTYTFQALSNDGIKMFLAQRLVVSDPEQHSDRLSPEATVNIPEAGWYPVRIDYFQRKGTAALKLFWKIPNSTTMSIVPASAYGHLPEQKAGS